MSSPRVFRTALRASRGRAFGVAKPDGPLGLEHLAVAVARVTCEGGDTLAITLRPETRTKREQLARGGGR
jgi:hypothetical protein